MDDLHKAQQFQALIENEYLKEALENVEKNAIEQMLQTKADEDDVRWKAQALVLGVRELRNELQSLKDSNTPVKVESHGVV